MAYMPGLRALAVKLTSAGRREDLIQDTLAYVLTHWDNFRHSGDYSGLWMWLKWQMRSVVSNQRDKRNVDIKDDPFGMVIGRVPTPASQEHAVELSMTLERLQTIPYGDTLLRFAAGEEQHELGEREGVSRQAVSLRCRRARDDLENGVSRRRPYRRSKKRMSAKLVAA